jgi:hypothetical protein
VFGCRRRCQLTILFLFLLQALRRGGLSRRRVTLSCLRVSVCLLPSSAHHSLSVFYCRRGGSRRRRVTMISFAIDSECNACFLAVICPRFLFLSFITGAEIGLRRRLVTMTLSAIDCFALHTELPTFSSLFAGSMVLWRCWWFVLH